MKTPICQGVQILIEELKLKYKFACLIEYCDVRSVIQKINGFLKLNVNGKIPVLLDNNSNAINGKSSPFAVMESAAIMFDLLKLSDVHQWIDWGTTELLIPIHELIGICREHVFHSPTHCDD
ncbi:hypothetical protein PtA15_14A329 [Puccinia triticina]|uniref:GST N-terminal domain-containing protein n=1 Tax=Puccinia triticina TaxID=208348 RepID=A0ABY7D635_9BASI|nr:uncharacterized protein PtA15_14A329 [Puccinia triticina]WAQ91445.1 hypothetical protein PtA15_14A329 [Puccinia triticina]WAR62250.1 hypothetical protein PtB15_14B345 [Puccinia triticina]